MHCLVTIVYKDNIGGCFAHDVTTKGSKSCSKCFRCYLSPVIIGTGGDNNGKEIRLPLYHGWNFYFLS